MTACANRSESLAEPRPPAAQKLRIFTLYADFAAAVRAKRVAGRIAVTAGAEWITVTDMWTLNSVGPTGVIGEMIAQDAAESDVLMVAMTCVDEPEPAVIRWLESLANRKARCGLSGLLVGVLGDVDRKVDDGNWMVGRLTDFARRAGVDLAWQTVDAAMMDDDSWLTGHVQKLLERKRSYARSTEPGTPNIAAS